jgi:alkyl hydroperoxide reductase subunit AhpF
MDAASGYTRKRRSGVALLTDDVVGQLKEAFQDLKEPVRLAVAFQALQDPESEEVKRLLEELAAIDPRLSVEPVNFVLDTDRVSSLGFTRTPAIAVLGGANGGIDHGIRLYGLPSGYEFGTLVEAILLVSRGESGLGDETKTALAGLAHPVHVQVFSTPT